MLWSRVRVLASYASLSLCSYSSVRCESRAYRTKLPLPSGCQHIGYVTDIEGNLDYWTSYKRMSRVLTINEQGRLLLKDDCILVFGGDVCDRGPGDLRVIQDLLELKANYPDRVFLILGNRDVNKLRFALDASDKLVDLDLLPYWIAPEQTTDTGAGSPARRIQWMLKNSMGAPLTFEYRRKELEELGLPSSDEDVAESFRDSVRSNGCLTKLLHQGQLALIIKDTLFIHGALHPHTIDIVPPKLQKQDRNLEEWVDALNSFKQQETEDYIENIDSYVSTSMRAPSSSWSNVGGYSHPQPGSRLIHYGMGWNSDKTVNPTIIYANFLDSKGKYSTISDEAADYCKAAGIKRIIVGHQPVGDCPLPIRAKLTDMTVLHGDTSYANDVKWMPFDKTPFSFVDDYPSPPVDSTRGSAVSEIIVSFGPQGESTATIHGVLSNNLMYEYSFSDPDARLLGREYDGWWAKTILFNSQASEKFILLSQKDGYKVTNKIVPIKEIL